MQTVERGGRVLSIRNVCFIEETPSIKYSFKLYWPLLLERV